MKRIASTAIALSLLAVGSVAMADSHRDHRDNRDHRNFSSEHRYSNGRRHDDRRDWRDDRRYENRGRYERDHSGHRYWAGEYRRPHGYYHRHWRRGEYLPRAYYARPYWLHHYRGYGLRSPPRGYYWVRVNNDAVLAAIASGIVLDVIYDNFY